MNHEPALQKNMLMYYMLPTKLLIQNYIWNSLKYLLIFIKNSKWHENSVKEILNFNASMNSSQYLECLIEIYEYAD